MFTWTVKRETAVQSLKKKKSIKAIDRETNEGFYLQTEYD